MCSQPIICAIDQGMTHPSTLLITGAAKRVGAVLALHLAESGYDIALHYHRSKSEAQALQAKIQQLGRRCEIFQQDLTEIAALPGLIAQIKEQMPHLAGLINNASIFERASLQDSDAELFDRQMTINLKAPIFLTQEFAKQVRKGCVINLLDTHITTHHTSHALYLLSKKSLGEFTQMAAREYGPDIRVNAICPGHVLPSSEYEEGYQDRLEAKNPLKKIATLKDIAQAAAYLLQANSVTGQLLYVDGGEHIAH